ncbi:PREDICTED: uncharacterized protein LOC106113989 [Papilio xuthus]|uniref:Uncharacterized protein LOC106113989 n=1 Tax=Papilio xuthus TaxID=66420 RepID=A0AAJ6Z093_PAPXU|nr:PREDICTED: uncharacterized protein LOC106113989 [Papilio xuthus]
MSDRGFGDQASRNVVKNPLLSTAVIGVSLEDLTHNAVLLPAVPNQELITRQDNQTGPQARSLRDPEQTQLDLSSGDSNSNIYHSHKLTNINPNPSNAQKNLDNNNTMESRSTTMSKASHNTEDDFDVNEYFARLHGTRYVSAPINSAVKEAENLAAVEENLEEINLNEPDKSTEEFQHSLTADIAQNFSQLPTVLPQVASAVFSSFSNMLSMKREHTDVKPVPDLVPGVPNEQIQKTQDVGVPLMSVPDVKEVAPPPTKPPLGTASNYRITTKKKMYAQIPGLRSADSSQNIANQPAHVNVPFYAPETQKSDTSTRIHDENTIEITGTNKNVDVTQFGSNNNMAQYPSNYPEQNQSGYEQKTIIDNLTVSMDNINKWQSIDNIQKDTIFTMQPNAPQTVPQSNMSVIPPPPMFSNQTKSDQNSVRSVLPPSIARRIAANNPIIKPQVPLSAPLQNIFVPSDIQSQPETVSSTYQGMTQDKPDTTIIESKMQHPVYKPSATKLRGIISQERDMSFVIEPNVHQPETSVCAMNYHGITSEKPDKSFIIDPKKHSGIANITSNIIKPATYGSNMSIFVSKEIPQGSILENIKGHSPIDIPQKISSPADLAVKQLSQMNLDPPITNLADELLGEKLNKSSKSESLPPPPKFYNQSAITDSNTGRKINEVPNIATVNKTLFEPKIAASDPTKNIREPPKIASNNFRMTMKKPQYYSGPIEGVGNISNNIKPTIYTEQADTFQGSLYTPQLPAQQFSDDSGITASVQSKDPFTATELAGNVGVYQHFNNPQPQTQSHVQSEFNTAFDLSRQTTEYFENTQQESKGFGIIGSLKSKLSSIDLNKIQNSVTTFFDPAYNYTKMDAANQENVYGSFPLQKTSQERDNSNLEIYVPTAEPASQSFAYNYQLPDNTIRQPGPYIYFQEASKSSDKPVHSYNTEANQKSPWAVDSSYGSNKKEDLKAVGTKINKNYATQEKETAKSNIEMTSFNQIFANPNTNSNVHFDPYKPQVTESNLCDRSFFSDSGFQANVPMQHLLHAKKDDKTSLMNFKSDEASNMKLSECFPSDKKDESSKEDLYKPEIKNNIPKVTNTEETASNVREPQMPKWDDIGFIYFKSSSNLPSGSTFDSQATAINNKEPTQTDVFVDSKAHQGFIFDQNAADFFDRPLSTEKQVVENVLETVLKEEESDHDLSICETCREVNKPEEKEVENLTDQLIENIIAPIQLSNPVEVPFTANESPDVNTNDFDPDQCDEISYMTEETIETLQEQEEDFMDGFTNSSAVPKNYEWLVEEPELTGPNVFTADNMPNNASDEIKAEYQSCFDEPLTEFAREMSTPSAPPAEEDANSDESGLDVHSIEQDATKDFPIYDDNVIEPSETDDDKIEFREREKSSEESIPDSDTFTNRIEKYKKMEETLDQSHDVFKTTESSKLYEVATSTSPSTTIASYFDTGNYAVENFYRNSLTSQSVSNLNISESQHPMTIVKVPPGFESLYPKQFYIIPNENYNAFATPDINPSQKPITYVLPDSNIYLPQPESSSLTYSYISTEKNDKPANENNANITEESTNEIMNISKVVLTTDTTESNVKLPDFATVFGTKKDQENIEETTEAASEETKITESSDSKNIEPEPSRKSPDVCDFSRLSSYFTSPSQNDPSKSFFELSQSENHYRHDMTSSTKCDKSNIPQDKYVSNMNLIKDLTSPANIESIPKEQIVRTVNYFTVLYDNDSFNNKIDTKNIEIPIVSDSDINLETPLSNTECNKVDIIETCKHCCSLESGVVKDINIENLKLGKNNVKIKQYMNEDNCELKKEVNMETKKETSGDRSFTVNFDNITIEEEKEENVTMITENRSSGEYSPVKHHWFYRVDCEGKSLWKGFSTVDSSALENAFVSPELSETTLVPTDGGRYDVNLMGRLRVPVYWSGKPTNVMRCSWFYKGTTDARYVPYSEVVAEKLEEEYKHGILTGEWHRRLILPNGELVVMHGPGVMVHFLQTNAADAFSSSSRLSDRKRVFRSPSTNYINPCQIGRNDHLVLFVHGVGQNRYANNQTTTRPRVVRRGVAESEIEDTEPGHVDHLLLLCHGVGSACDMRFRPVEEVVDDFRATSLQLIQSHYKNSYENGIVGRIEVLPISWHSTLHSGENGVDKRLAQVTLDSIPRLRNFTNDTVLDVLFYTSPVYCQTIVDTVCKELNRIYSLFKSRNPTFTGGVSLGGHSLGSVILYDLLCHQKPLDHTCSDKKYVNGTAGTGQPTVKYPILEFKPDALYALGSPIAIFECIRGVELLGSGFCLPTCKKFFNIFHPYDPIAYRIEPLINSQLRNVKPFQIPHHKGRKRMHLELKDTMARVGADIKQKLIESIRSTWTSMWKTQPPNDRQLEKVVEEEMEKEQLAEDKEEIHDTTET